MSPPLQNPVEQLQIALAQILSQTPILDSEPTQRKQVISFKVSLSEKQLLERRCEGIVLSDYIRGKLFDQPLPRPKRIMPKINRETLCWLKQMGANVQQHLQGIEQGMNEGKMSLTPEITPYLLELQNLQEAIHQLRLEMVNAYRQTLPHKDDD